RSLEAQLFGAEVRIRGSVTNASLIRDWKLPRKEPTDPLRPEGAFWHEFLTQADKVRPLATPSVTVLFQFDARDLGSLAATVKVSVPAVESPWGAATNLTLSARVIPRLRTNEPVQAEIKLGADQLRTPWGVATNMQLTARLEPSFTEPFPTNGTLKLELLRPTTPWGNADLIALDARTTPVSTNGAARITTVTLNVRQPRYDLESARSATVVARIVHAATNPLPASVESDTLVEDARTPWATSAWTRVQCSFDLPRADALMVMRTNLTWPERFKNIPFDLTAAFSNALAPKIEARELHITNRWRFPELKTAAALQNSAGMLGVEGTLDTGTRALVFHAIARGDPHALSPHLPTNALPWLAEYDSAAPLDAVIDGRAELPDWANWKSNGWTLAMHTASLAARVESGPAALHDIHFNAIQVAALYTNDHWTLPEIHFTRPEGFIDAHGEVDGTSGEFHLKLRSTIDPQALRPIFSRGDQQEIFEPFEFTVLPVLAGEARGNIRDLSTVSAMAAAAVTNVAYKKQFFRYATATGSYTNGFISVYRAVILRDGEQGGADGIGFDLRRERLYLTNAHGNLTPMVVARAIGPHIVKAIEAYHFDVPPVVRANGSIPTGRGDRSEDLQFEVEGGPFHWWRIHADRVRASIHWLGEDLTLTNIHATWRGANAAGWARFDFRQPKGGAMAFHLGAEGGDLNRIVQDLQNGTSNHLEGVVDVDLAVTHAFANDISSWNGYGHARLTNGLLWDIPLFGVASTILNGIIPGLGHSRAKSATATFLITNSVLHTKDLKIEASAMHLKYRGAVDFDGNIDARMDAELLKGVPVIGPLITAVFWPVTKLFEYRVTRTLSNPKLDEVYFIPKLLLLPFQPLKTMRNLFGSDEDKSDQPPPDRKPRKPPRTTP
ncbi:MAG: hypothetical protein QOF48_2340, partial [Verrucomicrobiota bacterium]